MRDGGEYEEVEEAGRGRESRCWGVRGGSRGHGRVERDTLLQARTHSRAGVSTPRTRSCGRLVLNTSQPKVHGELLRQLPTVGGRDLR